MNERDFAKINFNETSHPPDGSFEYPLIDSNMSRQEIEDFILESYPEAKEVLERQEILDVRYLNKEGKFCQGQIVVDRELAAEVEDFFKFLLDIQFGIDKVVPIQDKKYSGDDETSMQDNNSSAMNYRFIAGTERLSLHSFGFAIDINPWDNPVIKNGEILAPIGGVMPNLDDPQTLTAEHPVVKWLEEHGWEWGGRWGNDRYEDNHHFQKPLATEQYLQELEKQLQDGKISQEDFDGRVGVAKANLDLIQKHEQRTDTE
ncbi:M15 family metallopeptidase [bacterium]|nr:MAG: M15 family metallopeptidase [bacterium]